MMAPGGRSMPRWVPGALLLAVFLWLMRDTVSSMVAIWIRHQTYQHAFLVIPIVLWLVWRKRRLVSELVLEPIPWMLVPIGMALFMWLLGELAVVEAASQFALVLIIVLSVPALFGWPLTRALAFPLLFMFFSVPVGEFLVPTMMHLTADFTVGALRFVGVPVYREGLYFVIPSGSWSVIEACSGVRYLIASFMVGTLFAYLNYRSIRKRVAFAVVAAVVPLIANWLRAFMIVMIGHLSGNKLAVGVDHLLYGWVFFGIVIGLMFVVGARWTDADEEPSSSSIQSGNPRSFTAASTPNVSAVVAGILVLTMAAQGWKASAASYDSGEPTLPVAQSPNGWHEVDLPLPWSPGFTNASATREGAFEQDSGTRRAVWEWVGYYRNQGTDRKLVSSANAISDPEARDWRLVSESNYRPSGAALPSVHVAEIQHGAVLDMSKTGLRLWRVYWINGRWIANEPLAKIWQAFSALRLAGDDGAVLLLATQNDADANLVLEKYMAARLTVLGQELAATREAAFQSMSRMQP